MNTYYWQKYSDLLDYKDILDEYLNTLEENSEEYKKLDDLILDILDIDWYINQAMTKIEENKVYQKVIKDYYVNLN